jgi:hypothetical protein
MTAAMMNYIPLNSAYLCQDCNAVGNSSTRCPACASEVLMGLAGVFNRKEKVGGVEFDLVTRHGRINATNPSETRYGQSVPFLSC